ncbi:MAG: YqaE/Pmp3 family membrane protein [bacterium]|nr:YqaE/Pmp3 family membrane protein [bacterium]
MGCLRALLCIIFPPLAVLDRGCGTVVIVTLLTLAGWVPGAIAALILNFTAVQDRDRV